LLSKIRLDQDGPVLTPAEATLVLGKLERARVSSVDREGDGITWFNFDGQAHWRIAAL
jgi:hypothetical protein